LADVYYQIAVYKFNLDHYEYFYKSEVESGCTHEEVKDPILVFVFKESNKYGNITAACPLKVGHYQLRGFKIGEIVFRKLTFDFELVYIFYLDSDDLPHQNIPSGSYRFDFTASIKKDSKMHDIYTDKYYFTI
jgi:hypothetical protein